MPSRVVGGASRGDYRGVGRGADEIGEVTAINPGESYIDNKYHQ
jgi:hypothetical protein